MLLVWETDKAVEKPGWHCAVVGGQVYGWCAVNRVTLPTISPEAGYKEHKFVLSIREKLTDKWAEEMQKQAGASALVLAKMKE